MNYLAGIILVVSNFNEVETYVLFKTLLQKFGARWFYTDNKEDGKDGLVTFPLFLVFRFMMDELMAGTSNLYHNRQLTYLNDH